MSDPAKYRSRQEVQEVRAERDPIDRLRKTILEHGLADENAFKAIDKDIRAIVNEAASFAQDSPEPDPAELFTDVYSRRLSPDTAMPTEILMPALSPTMTEGNLARWLKREGDQVTAGDVIAEIETDKATMEIEAVDDGILGKILVPDGAEGIAVNTPIALLLGDGEDRAALDQAAAPASHAAPAEAPQLHPGRSRSA